MADQDQAGFAILRRLKSTDLPLWLTPNPSLSNDARKASVHLFSSLNPHCPKSPFDQLLIDGFDAEQIWQQIDLQSQPLLSTVKREVRRLEKSPEQVSKFFRVKEGNGGEKKEVVNGDVRENENLDGFDDDDDMDDDMNVDMEDLEELDDEDDDDDEEEEERESEESEGERESKKVGVEDEFLKIKELEKYMKEDEAREYGLEETGKKKNKKEKNKRSEVEDSDDEEEDDDGEEEEEGDEDDELGAFGMDDEDDEDKLEDARYEDFFGSKKNKATQRKPKRSEGSDEDATTSEDYDDIDADGDKRKDNLSTHEKELLDLKSTIAQMEKANLEPKTWTMQGEVTAAKRPKNSALEVDLDFEHNARPAPVITEEVTASLEELIKKRILEWHFDDVQKPPSLPSKAPKELKELDENKSKKGLAEIYEEEYAQKTNLASAPLSFSDEQKKEASLLFKRLCLKLDALSHFHFAPKPVIEDMSIQSNVPALAMEEIAPVAVSDAAMLAPEEVYAGKGGIKDEAELTQAERKRRRAKKKRKHKAEAVKRMAAKKTRETALPNHNEGKEE